MKTRSASTQQVELRKLTRYVLAVPARFWWGTAERVGGDCKGVTRDVSTAGAYVTAATCPPIGARVHMDILLPRMNEPSVGVRLHGEGTVLRVDGTHGRSCGFAAALQFYPEPLDESVLSLKIVS